MKALIALEDGRLFEGRSFTGPGETQGEMVFNTGMTGYQEVLTDPSYRGQIVAMTYPLIGNYGVTDADAESRRIFVEGFVVREYEEAYSNWRATESLGAYLVRHGIMGIDQVDTRAITRHIRRAGAMKAVISTEDLDPVSLVAKARISPGLLGRDLVSEVSPRGPYLWGPKRQEPVPASGFTDDPDVCYRVAVLDCGLKYNQLRIFARLGCECLVFPSWTRTDEIIARDPDGVFFSNGPGDPAALPGIVDVARTFLGRLPIFGICLGHQILGQALGGRTFKLKFGHHGLNQPVKNLETGRIEITSQNHGFSVDEATLQPDVEITHVNLNDHTVEGMRSRTAPAFSVQYHPENAPGPHDSEYLFARFIDMMAGYRV